MQSVEKAPRTYCPGCMSRADAQGLCGSPDCHWREVEQMESYDHLPRHFVLMERYYIGRVLGQGGFGVTYIARDLKFDDLVAVKEFLPREQCSRLSDRVTVSSHGGDKAESFRAGIDGFLEEARTLRKLAGHPNILSVKDFDKANGTAYLVMEYLSGRTLKQYLLAQGGKIPPMVAVEIMLHVMSGLRKVHANGMLHRDVSPDNIMLTNEGPVKLLDFGSARYAAGEQSKSLSIILKAGYSPEEQYRTRGKQGAWTDVYAVAATLYRCITGEVPPPALDRLSEGEDELVAPSKLCAGLEPTLEAAILKGLAVRAKDRYQTIEEFQQALLVAQKETIAREASAKESAEKQAAAKEAEAKPQVKSGPVVAVRQEHAMKTADAGGTRTFWDRALGTTIGRRLMASASLLAAVSYFFECFHPFPASIYIAGLTIGYMQVRLAAGVVFFICCYLSASGIARRSAVRWSAWFFWVAQIFSWTVPLAVHWQTSGYRTGLVLGAFAIESAVTLFLLPVMFAVERRSLRTIFSAVGVVVSGLGFVFLLNIFLEPLFVREYLYYYGALYSEVRAVRVLPLLLSSVLFLALSIRYSLPDELVRDAT